MTTVKIIKNGYFKWVGLGKAKASSNVTLIKDGHKNILVDAGGIGDEKKIIAGLKKEKLSPDKIDYVVITHYHPDHIACLHLFKNAIFFDSASKFKKDLFVLRLIKKITPNVKIFFTPGHTEESCSVLVKTEQGVIAVTGDLFWFSQRENIKRGYALDLKKFAQSRKKILKIADWIIPGHAGMFKVKK